MEQLPTLLPLQLPKNARRRQSETRVLCGSVTIVWLCGIGALIFSCFVASWEARAIVFACAVFLGPIIALCFIAPFLYFILEEASQ